MVVTLVCWTLLASNIIVYVYPIFISEQYEYSDATLILYIKTFRISMPYEYVIKTVFVVVEVHALASGCFLKQSPTILLRRSQRCTFQILNLV